MSSPANGLALNEKNKALAAVFAFEMLVIVPTSAMPVFMGGYVDVLGFELTLAGRISSAEALGMALGSIVVLVLFARPGWNLRRSVLISLLGFASANLVSSLTESAAIFGISRFVSGFSGGGIVFTTASLYISSFPNPGRPFAVFFGILFLIGPLGLMILPQIFDQFGMSSTYLVLSLATLCSLLFIRAYPAYRGQGPATAGGGDVCRQDAAKIVVGLLLLALFINYVFNGGIWVYMERLGVSLGLGDQQLGVLLGIGMLCGLLGTAAAWILAERCSRLTPILIGQALLIVSVLMFLNAESAGLFLAGNITFNASLTFFTPYYLSALARADSTGRSAMIGTLVFGFGYGLGPAALSLIVGEGNFTPALIVANLAFVVSVIFTLAAWFAERRPGGTFRSFRTL